MFDTLRRQLDDAYRAQDSGMSVGLPKVTVDASQLKHLLDHYDELNKYVRFVEFIAHDYVELSHDKVRLQRDDYIRRARKLLED